MSMSTAEISNEFLRLRSQDVNNGGGRIVGMEGIEGVKPTGLNPGDASTLQSMMEGATPHLRNAYYTSQWSSFSALITAIGSNSATVYVNSMVTLTGATSTPANIHVVPLHGGGFTAATAQNLTILGECDEALFQWVFGSVSVYLSNRACVSPQEHGTAGDDTADDAPGILSAIQTAQRSPGMTRVKPVGVYYIRQPVIFQRPASGDSRFEIRGDGTRDAWIEPSETVSAGSPLAAALQFDDTGGNIEDLVFEKFHIQGASRDDNYATGRANYGIDLADSYTPEATFRNLRIGSTLLSAIRTSTWDIYFERCVLRGNFGNGVECIDNENNAVNLWGMEIFSNGGFGLLYKGGNVLNVRDSVIEENLKGGVYIGGPARAVNVTGNYFEDNGATGISLTADSPRTVRADVIVNGGSLVNMSFAFPSFEFSASWNNHNGTVPIEFAYYLIGCVGAKIENVFHQASVGSHLKLIGIYGHSSYSFPQHVTIGRHSGFAKIARIDYSTLSGGTFTVGQYVGKQSGGNFIALGKVLYDDGVDLCFVMSQDKSQSTDTFAAGDSLISATLSGTTFTAGSVTATATRVSYRPKSIWIDGGVIENRRQAFASFREEGIERRNFYNKAPTELEFEAATAGSPVTIAITGSTAGSDTIQLDTSLLTSGDRAQINIAATAFGVTDLATYFIHVVDGSNATLHTTEADAVAGTSPVDITGDIGAGTLIPWNGTLTRETDKFMGLPVYKLSRKLKGQNRSGRVKFSIDLDSEEYERLCGRLVYFGCWVKQSDASVSVRFIANGLGSRDFEDYTTTLGWKWQEWYAELPYTGAVNFHIQFTAPDGDATNRDIQFTSPILSLVGVPYTDYGETRLIGSSVSDPSGGATVDAECRAQLTALLEQLRAAEVIES